VLRAKVLGMAAAAALALAGGPLTASACVLSNCGFNPLTHGAWTTFSCTATSAAKVVTSMEVAFPQGMYFTHATDSWAPANGTVVGSVAITGHWSFLFCTSATETFNVKWVSSPDGGYTPPTGWTVTAELQISSSLAGFDAYAISNGSGAYKLEVPSFPALFCSGSTTQVAMVIGSSGTVQYQILRNPSTPGTYSLSVTFGYGDGSQDSCSTTITIT
jgi:hypothetical protein